LRFISIFLQLKPIALSSNSLIMSIIELGGSIPALTPHVSSEPALKTLDSFYLKRVGSFYESKLICEQAASMSLPTWSDNVGYEEGDKRVLSKLTTGYPR
jgi:hypothetical protein